MPKRLSHVQAALDQLKAPGVFSLADAAAVGISQPTLSRLAAREEVIRLGDGYYAHPEGEDMAPGTFQWIVACARFGPRSLIGGMTALFHYHLIPQVPNQVWVVVPPEKKSTNSLYRCLRSTHDPKVCVEEHGRYRMATLERSIVEAFSYQAKMGLRTALTAARRAIKDDLTDERRLYKAAEALGVWTSVSKHWEAIRDDRFD